MNRSTDSDGIDAFLNRVKGVDSNNRMLITNRIGICVDDDGSIRASKVIIDKNFRFGEQYEHDIVAVAPIIENIPGFPVKGNIATVCQSCKFTYNGI
ncbi:hypothetical protein V202x_23780 [Gimesia aquarii]|uniref:Uncharacterized protein n=1 Tax=Gimesia aquarii TaxID=2527964 RepID=A0A517WUV3_9PLAN|nr:hypothetical protein V202x_23780 [Gimesia aquarii]